MRGRAQAAFLCAALAIRALPARAWDDLWAIRRDADVTRTVQALGGAVVSLVDDPLLHHGIAALVSGQVRYADDDKSAVLVVASAASTTVLTARTGNYQTGGMPGIGLFDLSAQLRLRPGLHLLYGAGLARSGFEPHATSSFLALHIGFALPLVGSSESMRRYDRGYLQVETRPVVASLLAEIPQEGYEDRAPPEPQVGCDVALAGRIVLPRSTVEGRLLLTWSYVHQRSVYLAVRLRWIGPVFWVRLAPIVEVSYVFPMRPRRTHLSEDAGALLYHHNLGLIAGLIVRL